MGLACRHELQAIISHARFDALSCTKTPDLRRNLAPVAAHDTATAMGEDGASNVFFAAPFQLRGDRRMPCESMVAHANHRSCHRCSVTDIERDAAQRGILIGNSGNVRYVKNRDAIVCDPIADGGCA